jgi:hypothetical protein
MQAEGPSQSPSDEAARELHKQASAWLVISLASSLLLLSLCLGIGGAVFCYLSMQASTHGFVQDAEDKLKWGKILTLVGSAIGVLSTTLSLIFR